MSSEPLPALLDRVRAGDEAALAELLQRHESQLRLAARRLLGPRLRSRIDDLDIVQSTQRALIQKVRTHQIDLAGVEPLLAMALTIVRRKVADQARQEQRHAAGVAAVGEQTTRQVDPVEGAAAREAVQKLLDEATGADRALVELRLEGYSTVEAATRLGLDPASARARLSRLRAKLRKAGGDDWL